MEDRPSPVHRCLYLSWISENKASENQASRVRCSCSPAKTFGEHDIGCSNDASLRLDYLQSPFTRIHPARLKYCTAFSCASAALRVLNVPRLRRFPVFASFFREYKRYCPELILRIMLCPTAPSWSKRSDALSAFNGQCRLHQSIVKSQVIRVWRHVRFRTMIPTRINPLRLARRWTCRQ